MFDCTLLEIYTLTRYLLSYLNFYSVLFAPCSDTVIKNNNDNKKKYCGHSMLHRIIPVVPHLPYCNLTFIHLLSFTVLFKYIILCHVIIIQHLSSFAIQFNQKCSMVVLQSLLLYPLIYLGPNNRGFILFING